MLRLLSKCASARRLSEQSQSALAERRLTAPAAERIEWVARGGRTAESTTAAEGVATASECTRAATKRCVLDGSMQ